MKGIAGLCQFKWGIEQDACPAGSHHPFARSLSHTDFFHLRDLVWLGRHNRSRTD
jgi:hypothetical protein